MHNQEALQSTETLSEELKQKPSIEIYDVAVVRKLFLSSASRYRDSEDAKVSKAILRKLVDKGGSRVLSSIPSNQAIDFLDTLEADFPNFKVVVDTIRGINALSSETEVLRIPPILLLGPPGVGKTMFAESLANGMQVPFRVIRMENQQAGAGIVGSSDFWSNSKTGILFDVLTEGDYANPVLVVDEVDKAPKGGQHNPINSLYSLLESGSAKSFSDESLPNIKIDASKVTWLLTANDQNNIPEPILSRTRVFDITEPNEVQASAIAKKIYKGLLKDSKALSQKFNKNITADVIEKLISLTPRKMKLEIEMALGKAAIAKRDHVIASDITTLKKSQSNKMGFI